MSETECKVGTLMEIPLAEGETIEDVIMQLLTEEQRNKIDTSYDGNVMACFRDNYYEEYIIYDGKLYRVDMKVEKWGEDIFHATHRQDGDIDFVVQYYNGSCSFEEAINEALKKLEGKNEPD